MDEVYDYHYYYRWTFIIPASLLAGIVGFGLFTPCLMWTVSRCIRRCCNPNTGDHVVTHYLQNAFRDVMIRVSKYFLLEFDYTVEEKDENEPYNTTYSYSMYSATVEFYVLQYFFIVFLSMIMVSFILFWNTFTSSVFIGCDPYYDCFPLHASNETPIQTLPLKDCSRYSGNENVTILCFQLVYKYSEGIGEAGGFLFIMQVIVNLLIYITVRIQTIFANAYIEFRKRYIHRSSVVNAKLIRVCSLIVTMLLIPTGYALITVGIPLGFYRIRPEFYASLQTPQRFLQFMIYLFINFVLILIPIFVGRGTRDNLLKETQISNNNDSQEKSESSKDNIVVSIV